MNDHFGRVGTSLKGAVDSYNKAMASLETRVLVSARRFQDLKATDTGKEIGAPLQIDATPRTVAEGGS
jgi:DNA recombination protein RmuC